MPHFLNVLKVRPRLDFVVTEGSPRIKTLASLQLTRNPNNPLHAQPCIVSLEKDSESCAVVFFDGGTLVSITQLTPSMQENVQPTNKMFLHEARQIRIPHIARVESNLERLQILIKLHKPLTKFRSRD